MEYLFKRYREMKELLLQKFKKSFLEKSLNKSRTIFKKSLDSSNPSLVSLYQISKL